MAQNDWRSAKRDVRAATRPTSVDGAVIAHLDVNGAHDVRAATRPTSVDGAVIAHLDVNGAHDVRAATRPTSVDEPPVVPVFAPTEMSGQRHALRVSTPRRQTPGPCGGGGDVRAATRPTSVDNATPLGSDHGPLERCQGSDTPYECRHRLRAELLLPLRARCQGSDTPYECRPMKIGAHFQWSEPDVRAATRPTSVDTVLAAVLPKMWPMSGQRHALRVSTELLGLLASVRAAWDVRAATRPTSVDSPTAMPRSATVRSMSGQRHALRVSTRRPSHVQRCVLRDVRAATRPTSVDNGIAILGPLALATDVRAATRPTSVDPSMWPSIAQITLPRCHGSDTPYECRPLKKSCYWELVTGDDVRAATRPTSVDVSRPGTTRQHGMDVRAATRPTSVDLRTWQRSSRARRDDVRAATRPTSVDGNDPTCARDPDHAQDVRAATRPTSVDAASFTVTAIMNGNRCQGSDTPYECRLHRFCTTTPTSQRDVRAATRPTSVDSDGLWLCTESFGFALNRSGRMSGQRHALRVSTSPSRRHRAFARDDVRAATRPTSVDQIVPSNACESRTRMSGQRHALRVSTTTPSTRCRRLSTMSGQRHALRVSTASKISSSTSTCSMSGQRHALRVSTPPTPRRLARVCTMSGQRHALRVCSDTPYECRLRHQASQPIGTVYSQYRARGPRSERIICVNTPSGAGIGFRVRYVTRARGARKAKRRRSRRRDVLCNLKEGRR